MEEGAEGGGGGGEKGQENGVLEVPLLRSTGILYSTWALRLSRMQSMYVHTVL